MPTYALFGFVASFDQAHEFGHAVAMEVWWSERVLLHKTLKSGLFQKQNSTSYYNNVPQRPTEAEI